jgi:hypothetical protein
MRRPKLCIKSCNAIIIRRRLFSSHEYTGTKTASLEMLRRDAELLPPPLYS